jgi:YesN/AraC family two-component response regulator
MYKILIAEDEQPVLQGIHNALSQVDQVEVIAVCTSGTQAVDFIKHSYVDMIITDIIMPGCSGLELIKVYRDMGKTGQIIILSGHSEFSFAQEAIRMSVSDYLLKPFDQFALMEKVKNEIRKSNHFQGSISIFSERQTEINQTLLNSNTTIGKILSFINRNYKQDLTIGSLCQEFLMSESYFYKLFKGNTGITFNEYLTNIRISEACDLLCSTQLKIYEIAEKTGYNNPKYFAEVFKHVIGMSPADFKYAKAQNTTI